MNKRKTYKLGAIATRFGGKLIGNPDIRISRVATLMANRMSSSTRAAPHASCCQFAYPFCPASKITRGSAPMGCVRPWGQNWNPPVVTRIAAVSPPARAAARSAPVMMALRAEPSTTRSVTR